MLGSLGETKNSAVAKNGRYKDTRKAYDVIKTSTAPFPPFFFGKGRKNERPSDYSPVSDVWLDETKHLLSGFGDSDEDAVVDLE